MILTVIEEQVCSPVLARHLKAVGVPQVSQYYFWRGQRQDQSPFYDIIRLHHQSTEFVMNSVERWSAYTSGELGAMLPPTATTRRFFDAPHMWLCEVAGVGGYAADKEADARGKMLLRMCGMPDPDIPLDLPQESETCQQGSEGKVGCL